MKYVVFTSINAAYLPNARVLAYSIKKHHPDWKFCLLFNDRMPEGFSEEDEPFDLVLLAEWLPMNEPFRRWAFGYSVVEFCTATKGVAAEFLLKNFGYDAVVYLDPDTMVFSPMVEVEELIETEKYDVLLTPHLTDPEDTEDTYSIWSHEMAALKHGTFNLGFFVVARRPAGLKFLRWWAARLVKYSQIDFNSGLFTDQKWANLAPYMFESVHVMRDRNYNVATWNMKNRNIHRNDNGVWMLNDLPLRFYHFSGFGSDFAWAMTELRRLAPEQHGLRDLWMGYKEALMSFRDGMEKTPWFYGFYSNGLAIEPSLRREDTSNLIDPFELNKV